MTSNSLNARQRRMRARTARLLSTSGIAVTALLLAYAGPAQAFTYTFDDGIQIRFDNNVEYSLTERTAPASAQLTNDGGSLNSNDGDNNLRSGIVSNRLQDVTQFDISDNGYGVDASTESFYDSIYETKNQNTDPTSVNAITSGPKFAPGTSALIGRNIELRNLYGYGSFALGSVPVTFRIGRHTLVWGESVFFPDNGIADGIMPSDAVEATSEPNAEAKDIFLPVGMASFSAQLTDTIRLEGYYQFEFEKTIIPPAGSYFGATDILDGGGERILLAQPQPPFFPGLYFFRGKDIRGATTGQFGAAVHYDPVSSPFDFGVYALQFNDRTPQVYVHPNPFGPGFTPNGLSEGTYDLAYANHIQLYGVSASTTVGSLNIAGEVSERVGTDLINNGVVILPGETADNNHNIRYPTGDVAYAQASVIYLGPATKLWGASALVGEIAAQHLTAVLKNGNAFVQSNGGGRSHTSAAAFHVLFTPTDYEVVSGVDLSLPIGLIYSFWGGSPTSPAFNGTDQSHGGIATIGLTATYNGSWNAGVTYAQYFGPISYSNLYADRSNISFNIQHTF